MGASTRLSTEEGGGGRGEGGGRLGREKLRRPAPESARQRRDTDAGVVVTASSPRLCLCRHYSVHPAPLSVSSLQRQARTSVSSLQRQACTSVCVVVTASSLHLCLCRRYSVKPATSVCVVVTSVQACTSVSSLQRQACTSVSSPESSSRLSLSCRRYSVQPASCLCRPQGNTACFSVCLLILPASQPVSVSCGIASQPASLCVLWYSQPASQSL